ncbi:hypothetical protein XH98_15340 [Bradyrhizobium sp. CCBAU 51745]|nr:hypothetical protein [Bradyrhizobium sp. CCBAU 51745]
MNCLEHAAHLANLARRVVAEDVVVKGGHAAFWARIEQEPAKLSTRSLQQSEMTVRDPAKIAVDFSKASGIAGVVSGPRVRGTTNSGVLNLSARGAMMI